jgi:hypothetical protein
MGPWAIGGFLDRIAVTVYALTNPGAATVLQVGFGLSGSPARTLGNWGASSKLISGYVGATGRYPYARVQLREGTGVSFEVDVGQRIGPGAQWLVVFHMAADPNAVYELFVSVRTREEAVVALPGGAGVKGAVG